MLIVVFTVLLIFFDYFSIIKLAYALREVL